MVIILTIIPKKQNPKVKQNALHTYITYMIYNDLAHGNTRKHVSLFVPFSVSLLILIIINIANI